MAYDTRQNAWIEMQKKKKKKKKSVVNHFKNPIEAMVMKDNVSHNSHSVYLIKTVNKRGERGSQSYDNSNVSP